MKTIHIYDPPMCCSTGICGTEVDPDIINFAAMLSQLAKKGIHIERHNLAKEPLAFVKNPAVKELLQAEGEKALPLIFRDGELHLKGRYPNKIERSDLIRAAHDSEEMTS